MPSFIDQAADSLKKTFTPATPPDRGDELISQLATGGLMLGGGVSAAVALVNYLKSLKKEEELNDESRLNDDTLYIQAPPSGKEKSATAKDWLAPGVGLTAGVVGAGGAYALTQMVYNFAMKKRRQRMLDEAQNETIALSDAEIEKSADTKMTFSDLVLAFPVAVPLLAAMASGGVAYAALNKTFPTIKRPGLKGPRRIRQVSGPGEIEDVTDEYLPKSAAAKKDFEECGDEFLLLVTDQMATEKRASISLTSDLLNAAAKHGTGGMAHAYEAGGLEALIEIVKGASDSPADLPGRVVAAALICKSAKLRPVASVLASSEYQDMAPDIYDTVSRQDPDAIEKLASVGALMHAVMFRPHLVKAGASYSVASDQLRDTLKSQQPKEIEEALQTDAGGVLASESEESGGAGDGEINKGAEDDPVDEFMAFDNPNPTLESD